MNTEFRIVFFLAGCLFLCSCGKKIVKDHKDARPWRDFVADLCDIDRMASLDTVSTRFISSYDRTGGNDDYNYFEKEGSEPGWVVIADIKGPGCVRRWWTTGADLGHPFKVYFNDEKEPRISGPVEQVFGGTSPFEPPLARYLNLCWFSYIPLTFEKSIRIETLRPPVHPKYGQRRLFYQLNVDVFQKDSHVQTFPRQLSPEDLAVLEKTAAEWTDAVEWPVLPSASPASRVESEKETTVYSSEGPGLLKAFWISARPADPDEWSVLERQYMLQDVVLRISYDGLDVNSIDVPLGDFFCNAWRKRCFGSLCVGSGSECFECRLPIPYAKGISVRVYNGAERAIGVNFAAETGAYSDVSAPGYLHAEWRRSGPAAGTPHLIADFKGKGKYAGTFLAVTGLDDSWWILEGDETMFVDGGLDPVWHGTGLEDYFNAGWYYRGACFSALHGVMDRAPFRAAQYRFHLVDSINFDTSFRMEIERGDRNVSNGHMKSVAYAYLEAPVAVSACPTDRTKRRAVDNPMIEKTLMVQLFELERMNDFRAASMTINEFIERHPESPWKGVLKLRGLEYDRLMGQEVTQADYEPFVKGKHGEQAAQEAMMLTWFYEKPGRVLVAACANGMARVFYDGSGIFNFDHPLKLSVWGTEGADGHHVLAARVGMERPGPWLQMGVRVGNDVAGTGPAAFSSLDPGEGWNRGGRGAGWSPVPMHMIARGVPDAPIVGSFPNAFVLLQSKVYGISADDWAYYKGNAFFRVDFDIPLGPNQSVPRRMTGLGE